MDGLGLPKCDANYVPLTPITFLKRASSVYVDRPSVVHGRSRFTWSQTYERCLRLASSLVRSLHVSKKSVVSVLAPNVPAMYEMHFSVPMGGAVIDAINTRLNATNVATILRQSEANVFFVDWEYVCKARDALEILAELQRCAESEDSGNNHSPSPLPLVVVMDGINSPTGNRIGEVEDYEELIRRGDPDFLPERLQDEWDRIALNYTSGTTSEPNGVVYSHRGAYLSTLSLIMGWEMRTAPVYLWSLPMFHCNGWTFTWGIAARGGTNICIRSPSANDIYRSIAEHKVKHMCCTPVIFNILLEAKTYERRPLKSRVEFLTDGAPSPAALLLKMESLGFHVTHAYGLTEATGPALLCEWQAQWNDLKPENRAKLKERRCISILSLADVDMKNPETMKSVERDGKTMGEIVFRGSSIMKGYYKDTEATSKAFKNGWFLTGDVGMIHLDGYIEINDRSKDIIISGGKNISSVELVACCTHT